MQLIDDKDPHLWKVAQKRAAFKNHLMTYIIVNGFFWCIWLFTEDHITMGWSNIPWPLWTTLTWGIWVVWDYHDAYYGDEKSVAEEEYEKLKREKERR